MFSEVFERFIQNRPVAVMVRVLLESLLNADHLDRWFNTVRQSQYTKDILFSSIVGLMLNVVGNIRPSVHSAYRHSEIETSAGRPVWQITKSGTDDFAGFSALYCGRSGIPHPSHRGNESALTPRVSGQVFRWELDRSHRTSLRGSAGDEGGRVTR